MNGNSVNSGTGALTKVADDIWIFDDIPIKSAGLRLPVRMTVIRLAGGDLLLHSPTRYSSALHQDLERLGRIKYLVAPNVAHWTFLPKWQRSVPDALTLAAPGLAARGQVRETGLRIDRELVGDSPEDWSGEIETVLVSAPLFAEVALFHKPSRTLVLTDLVQNIRPDELPSTARVLADFMGITAPSGKAPLYLRLLLRLGGRAAETAAARLIRFAPERVIFSHGDWFKSDATNQLRRSLKWLTDDRPDTALLGYDKQGEMAGLRVVITGASSGIGRATALAFAKRGARVVLAARRGSILQRVGAECEELGGRALVVPTDVTDADAVKRLADKAEDVFGGIDVWINNAGTGVFGPYQEADFALHRKTIEVNLLGTMHGAFAVLPVFLRQSRGILINNVSIGGWAPTPFAAAYTASKFGLRGFTASLRQELANRSGIHVCGIFPAMVDTPGFSHGANMSGRHIDPGPLLYQPEDVAEAFVELVRRPRDEVAVGWPARAGQISYAMAPRPTEQLMASAFRFLLRRARPAARTEGTMLVPKSEGVGTTGGWLMGKGIPPAGQISKLAVVGGIAALAVGAIAMSRSGDRRRATHLSDRSRRRLQAYSTK